MIDPDARMWCTHGAEMTVVEIGKCPTLNSASARRKKLTTWLNEHITGEYITTPWLIGFEHGPDATFFQVAYK